MAPPSSTARLNKFLRKYSSKGKGNVLKEWVLIEVRDVGKRKDLICPCGRSGLRYVCFIRNKITHKNTYVGSKCVRKFTHKNVPRLMMLLESLAINGVSARYLGYAGGQGRHRWEIKPSCKIIRQAKLLGYFFSNLPFAKSSSGVYEMYAYIRHNQYTFKTPRPKKGKIYTLTLGPVTGRPDEARPGLFFYADRIRPVGRQRGWGKNVR